MPTPCSTACGCREPRSAESLSEGQVNGSSSERSGALGEISWDALCYAAGHGISRKSKGKTSHIHYIIYEYIQILIGRLEHVFFNDFPYLGNN